MMRRVTRPFGRPVHPVVGAVAVGCLTASLAFDAVSRVSSTEFVYARGAYLLTGLGVAASVVASLIGLVDLTAIDRSTAAFRTGVRHLVAMDVALVLFTISFLIRRNSDFEFHDPTIAIASVLSAAGLLAIAIGLWHANRLVFTHGVGHVTAGGGEGDRGSGGGTDEEA